MRWISATTGVLLAATRLSAQRPGMEDPSFQQAATVLLMYDWYAAKCAKLSLPDSAEVDAWRRANRVELVRHRMAELQRATPPDAKLAEAERNVARTLRFVPVPGCTALVSLIRTENARFAARAPRLLASLQSATPSIDTADASQGPASAGGTAAPRERSGADRDDLLSQIEGFGFNSATTMGVGGFLTTRIFPVVLFRSGDLLADVAALSFAAGVVQHRRQHPGDWTRWRRAGADIEQLNRGTWERLPFRTTYSVLPTDFRLDGNFRSLAGTGTLAVGGDQAVTAWRGYRFFPDGRVERTGGAGAQAGRVVTSSSAQSARGRYRVSGLEVILSWEDGTTERRILIADPADPRTAIWLDGVGYARRDPRE
jgi:hypothetical protein